MFYHQYVQQSKRVIIRNEVKSILQPFQLAEEQLRRIMANLSTEMMNGLIVDGALDNNDLAIFPSYVHHGPSGQEVGRISRRWRWFEFSCFTCIH